MKGAYRLIEFKIDILTMLLHSNGFVSLRVSVLNVLLNTMKNKVLNCQFQLNMLEIGKNIKF